jgi:hypothetical protein
MQIGSGLLFKKKKISARRVEPGVNRKWGYSCREMLDPNPDSMNPDPQLCKKTTQCYSRTWALSALYCLVCILQVSLNCFLMRISFCFKLLGCCLISRACFFFSSRWDRFMYSSCRNNNRTLRFSVLWTAGGGGG